ncbi:hypothetical protein [Paraburkholderia unamae]|uniref:Uncharacterized protein n=1 Tax=Paraburkholderia unamae TaxID=219649 RepID=A0ACC6RT07_9BURK
MSTDTSFLEPSFQIEDEVLVAYKSVFFLKETLRTSDSKMARAKLRKRNNGHPDQCVDLKCIRGKDEKQREDHGSPRVSIEAAKTVYQQGFFPSVS